MPSYERSAHENDANRGGAALLVLLGSPVLAQTAADAQSIRGSLMDQARDALAKQSSPPRRFEWSTLQRVVAEGGSLWILD